MIQKYIMAKKKKKIVVRKKAEETLKERPAQAKVVKTQPKVVKTQAKTKTRPKRTLKKRTTKSATSSSWWSQPFKNSGEALLFGRENYMLMIGGLVLVIIGFALMSGGAMPDPDTWNDDIIYSFRRTVLAPFVVLMGLGVEIYAIFKRPANAE